jgi:hypothetical protein
VVAGLADTAPWPRVEACEVNEVRQVEGAAAVAMDTPGMADTEYPPPRDNSGVLFGWAAVLEGRSPAVAADEADKAPGRRLQTWGSEGVREVDVLSALLRAGAPKARGSGEWRVVSNRAEGGSEGLATGVDGGSRSGNSAGKVAGRSGRRVTAERAGCGRRSLAAWGLVDFKEMGSAPVLPVMPVTRHIEGLVGGGVPVDPASKGVAPSPSPFPSKLSFLATSLQKKNIHRPH